MHHPFTWHSRQHNTYTWYAAQSALLSIQFNKPQLNCSRCHSVRFPVQRGHTAACTDIWPSLTLGQAWLRSQCFLYCTFSQLLYFVDVLYWVLVHRGVRKVDKLEELHVGRWIATARFLQSSGIWCWLVWRTSDGSCTSELRITHARTNTHTNPHRLTPTAYARTQQDTITYYCIGFPCIICVPTVEISKEIHEISHL
jgi:hypothetical protein